MIGILAKIAYHGQLRRADPGLAEEMEAVIRGVAGELDAALPSREESYLLLFEAEPGCTQLRSAEALRRLGLHFRGLERRLHGWNLILEAGAESPEALAAELERLWLRCEGDGLFLGPKAIPLLAGYIELGEGALPPDTGFPYARAALPEGYSPPLPDPSALERFIEELRRLSQGSAATEILVATGPGASALLEAAFAGAGLDSSSILRLGAGIRPAPYGPFLQALPASSPPPAGLLSPHEAAFLAELEPAAAFIASSPCRRRYSKALQARYARYLGLRLELWARGLRAEGRGPLILLEGLDAFPPESLELLETLLDPATGPFAAHPPLLLASSAGLPPRFKRLALRRLSAPPPSPGAIAAAALSGAAAVGKPGLAPELARLARGEPFRLSLGLRLAAAGLLPRRSLGTAELAVACLATLPPEFSAFLRALDLAEDILEEGALRDFLRAAGFSAGLRPLLYGSLGELGYLERGSGRIASLEAGFASTAEPGRIEAIFAERLLKLHETRRLHPSLALHRRFFAEPLPLGAAEAKRRALFLLDCLASEELYGPSEAEGSGEEGGPEGELGLLGPFLLASGRGSEAEAALARERLLARRGAGDCSVIFSLVAELAGAFDDYARGRAAAAASAVRPVIIGLHGLGAKRAEARAHRLLGLTSLAQSQVQEGAEYLSNAGELAELLPDHLEGFLAAYAGAGAALVLGDLGRAALLRQKAAAEAAAAFRSDWEAACDFLSGRIAFELGRYEEAESQFGRAHAGATAYGEAEAVLRAEIWAGRAAASRGSVGRARELLEARREDPEALWFLAELSAWEGAWAEAAALSGASLLRQSLYQPRYDSADALSWRSGFDNAEGRALGFGGPRSYLADQVEAFAAFARGMAEGDPASIQSITELSRGRRLAALHPQAQLYDFYCYLISERLGSAPLDGGSYLSRSWKALQTRTARMDESGLKDSFLEGNRWNREILRSARLAKLL